MPLEIGIVGPRGAGKTTLLNALTGAGADLHDDREHVGVAAIADHRVARLATISGSRKTTLATIRILDAPGAGAALLGHLRQVDGLLAVVDGFSPGCDPARDLEALRLELLVADRDHVEKRLERVRTQAKSGDLRLRQEVADLERLVVHLDAGGTLLDYDRGLPAELEPLTPKPLVAVTNGPEGIDAKLECELAELDPAEAAEFRGGEAGALDQVTARLFEALDLICFFTSNENETRAWTLRHGRTALDAAETVHTDMARGFIRCEVIRWADLVECGSRAEAQRRGLVRLEGRGYVVEDGDVLQVRFNV